MSRLTIDHNLSLLNGKLISKRFISLAYHAFKQLPIFVKLYSEYNYAAD